MSINISGLQCVDKQDSVWREILAGKLKNETAKNIFWSEIFKTCPLHPHVESLCFIRLFFHLVFPPLCQPSSPVFLSSCLLFSFLSCPVLPVSLSVPLQGPPNTDRWIQQTDASGGPARLDRCVSRETSPCIYLRISLQPCPARLSARQSSYHPLYLYIIPLSFSFALFFFLSKSRRLPSLSGKLKFLSFHLYLRRPISLFSLYISPLISLCISLPLPFFLRGQTTSSTPLYLLDVISNFHIRSDKKNIARSVISHSCAEGSILFATTIFFFLRGYCSD